MRALMATLGREGAVQLDDVDEPDPAEGAVLVETLRLGVCGTDREILAGRHGEPPPGRETLVLGHESLGRVLEAPALSGLERGDLVVGVVRHPDPVPCSSCAAGEPDMCRNGRYTERGIKGRHGFGRERFRVEPSFALKVPRALGELGVLVEPASVVAKAWDHIEHIGRRAAWAPRRALITGAGPVGLLAALMAVERGFELLVLDRAKGGLKPTLVEALGGTYLAEDLEGACRDVDVVVECTGAPRVILELLRCRPPNSVLCLGGLSPSRPLELDVGRWNARMVIGNEVVFGSVNASRRHYARALTSLERADPAWLERLINRRVPLSQAADAFVDHPDDVKVVVDFER
jgi:threonine dehydrogenase-like Zn-dependent dehydrogenase